MHIWALTDNRPGNNSQSLGLANAMQQLGNHTMEAAPVNYRWIARLPSVLLPRCVGIATIPSSLRPPDVIIAAGRRAGMVARHFKHRFGPQVKLVQLMDPGAHHAAFDALVLPAHDTRAQALVHRHPHAFLCQGALHRLTLATIAAQQKKWGKDLKAYKAPFIAVILGGSTRYGIFGLKEAKILAFQLNALAEDRGATLLITNSRRTSQLAMAELVAHLSVPHHSWLWHPNITPKTNPYPGMLGLADEIVVTGESMSMLSEACITGKPVWIADIGAAVAPKHHRLHLELIEHDHAMMLEMPPALPFKATPLDETTRIAGLVARHLGL
jgi:mitochondrial fission protein ELM1